MTMEKRLKEGDNVRFVGHPLAEINGRTGTIIKAVYSIVDWYEVQINADTAYRADRCHLIKIDDDIDEALDRATDAANAALRPDCDRMVYLNAFRKRMRQEGFVRDHRTFRWKPAPDVCPLLAEIYGATNPFKVQIGPKRVQLAQKTK